MGSVLLETSRQKRLLQVMEERGFTLNQHNGQRVYGGPPPNWGTRAPPSRESEIFIGRIPRLCFEDELIPLFSSIGELYEFRLMLSFSGINRGFAYAQYADEVSALKAIKLLHHYEIRPGHRIGVLRCKNNCRLLFSNIKEDFSLDNFSEKIKSLTRDTMKITMYKNFEELNRIEIGVSLEIDEVFQDRITRYDPECKFAIVEYETHKAAAIARRKLIPKLGHIFGIDWAIPPKDSSQFDQAVTSRFENTLVEGNNFLKFRPVPVFNAPRSNLDAVLYFTSPFRNIAKYFRFLVNTTLHKAMRKGNIPLSVYLELEKKIIERMKNIQHCSQATQLLLNYLTWYREKMIMFLDPESEKILVEVKYYSEKMLEIANSRMTLPRGYRYCLEEQPQNALPIYLNYCYYMAVFLGGEERDKVCGLITNSLGWFSKMTQKAQGGDLEVNQFITELSRLALEMEEDKRRHPQFASPEKIRKRKPEILMPIPTQNAVGWNPFSGQSFPPLKKSAVSTQSDNENMEIDPSGKSEPSTAFSIPEGSSRAFNAMSIQLKRVSFQSSENTIGRNSIGPDSSVNSTKSSTVVSIYLGGNRDENNNIAQPYIAHRTYESAATEFPEFGTFNTNSLQTPKENGFLNGAGGCMPFNRSVFMDAGTGFRSRAITTAPLLLAHPTTANYSAMPKQFFNICPFYKYLIIANLQKSVERREVTVNTYREITTRIINNITHLEACDEAVELIVGYLRCNRDGVNSAPNDSLFKALEDIKMYSSAIMNYMQTRESSSSRNVSLDEYYLLFVPNQMSFLYHLIMLLEQEGRDRLSGRLTESVKWLHELVQKNRNGDIAVMGFFERTIHLGEGNHIREIIKEAYEEFNTISRLSAGANNYTIPC